MSLSYKTESKVLRVLDGRSPLVEGKPHYFSVCIIFKFYHHIIGSNISCDSFVERLYKHDTYLILERWREITKTFLT